MTARTFHVYRSDGGWTVKKVGQSARIYRTQREAVAAARRLIRVESPGQFVLHRGDGSIAQYGVYGMPRIQPHPRKSPKAGLIGQVIGKMALERVKSDVDRHRVRPPEE